MNKNRLEAFSDGVLAIIITIMVLEMHAPHEYDWRALKSLLPTFVSYVLSFIYVGIYCNNHHHLMHAVSRIGGGVLWANLHLLFWLSLIPFVTKWMGDSNFSTFPVALYGIVLLLCGIAWEILRRQLVKRHDRKSVLVTAVGDGWQEVTSITLYLIGIGMSFFLPWVGCLLYALVAVIWFIPDRRIERAMMSSDGS